MTREIVISSLENIILWSRPALHRVSRKQKQGMDQLALVCFSHIVLSCQRLCKAAGESELGEQVKDRRT